MTYQDKKMLEQNIIYWLKDGWTQSDRRHQEENSETILRKELVTYYKSVCTEINGYLSTGQKIGANSGNLVEGCLVDFYMSGNSYARLSVERKIVERELGGLKYTCFDGYTLKGMWSEISSEDPYSFGPHIARECGRRLKVAKQHRQRTMP